MSPIDIVIAVGAVLIVAASVFGFLRNQKKGKSGCGCGCSGCAQEENCNKS